MASITKLSLRSWLNSPRLLWQDLRLRIFFIILLFAIFIWFGGPYIAINNNSFLATINHRLTAILLLTLIWAVLNLRTTPKKGSLANSTEKKTLLTNSTAVFLPPHAVTAEI